MSAVYKTFDIIKIIFYNYIIDVGKLFLGVDRRKVKEE